MRPEDTVAHGLFNARGTIALLAGVRDGCDPATFYSAIRPWFRGADSDPAICGPILPFFTELGCDVRPQTRDKLQSVADSVDSIVAGKEHDFVALLPEAVWEDDEEAGTAKGLMRQFFSGQRREYSSLIDDTLKTYVNPEV
ncbi:hypothetical protein B0H13DRAFT_2567491 [Mycena leptocephala]|nr:hypothetical protein B0H13DRAFT_2567491 [Mycena leptocephala]